MEKLIKHADRNMVDPMKGSHPRRILIMKIQNTYGIKLDEAQQKAVWRAFQWGREDASRVIGYAVEGIHEDAIVTMGSER